MSVDYTAVLAIGKQFEDKSEAVCFLEQHLKLSDEDMEMVDEEGLDEWAYEKYPQLDIECLNLYSGDYYYVGIKLSPREYRDFTRQVEEVIETWEATFPGIEPEFIHTVKVH